MKAAVAYKQNTTDFLDQVMQELEVWEISQSTQCGRLATGHNCLLNVSGGCQTGQAYFLRANKLKTATVQGSLALSGPIMIMHNAVYITEDG